MAPGMVLAPALGDGGRAVFRKWAVLRQRPMSQAGR